MKLWNCLDEIKDPRNASGRRYALGSIMKLLLAGLLSGRQSLAQIVLWGRSLSQGTLKLLGFEKTVPCIATLSNLLKRIEIENVEKQLSSYTLKGQALLRAGTHLAIDGKTLRATHEEGVPLVHLLSVFAVNLQGVIGQVRMETGENEIKAGLRLLAELPLEGTIITGDAIFTQKKFAN